ncbi:HAMP domain-containing histidine kinase [bacterium]|nr:HAMP domain-containing histidine kinase [bacterium]
MNGPREISDELDKAGAASMATPARLELTSRKIAKILIENFEFGDALAGALTNLHELVPTRVVEAFRVIDGHAIRIFFWSPDGVLIDDASDDDETLEALWAGVKAPRAAHTASLLVDVPAEDLPTWAAEVSGAGSNWLLLDDSDPRRTFVMRLAVADSNAAEVPGLRELVTKVSDWIGALCRRHEMDLELELIRVKEQELTRRVLLKSMKDANLKREEARQASKKLEAQNEDLKVAMRRAEESDRLKTEFLSTASHELKTPLNAVIGHLNMFQQLAKTQSATPEEQAEMIGIAQQRAEQLSAIIDDILQISKIEAQQVASMTMDVEVADLMRELQSVVRQKIGEADIHYEDPVPADLTVAMDLPKVRQVLMNLIDNAVKFGEGRPVTVSVAGYEDGFAEFRVEDEGVGLEMHQLERVFEPFFQADGGMNRRFGGTGLGLAIARKLAEAIGGSVYLDSEGLGEGTCAVFRIPWRTVPEAEECSATDEPAADDPGHGFRVLYAHLDPRIVHQIAAQTEHDADLVVCECEDFGDIDRFESPPGLLIVGMNAQDAADHLIARACQTGVPTIVVSSVPDAIVRRKIELLAHPMILLVISETRVLADPSTMVRTVDRLRRFGSKSSPKIGAAASGFHFTTKID